MSEPVHHILGVRHHGPGSARSVVRALARVKPACVLMEGPPDAQDVLALAAIEGMKPPVAMLVYATDEPTRAAYWPAAEFSPEWVALRWAQQAGVPVKMMDLPMWHRMAIDQAEEAAFKASAEAAQKAISETLGVDVDEDEPDEAAEIAGPAAAESRRLAAKLLEMYDDPLNALAKIAGFDDGERWWEQMVEHRRGEVGDDTGAADVAMFAAILDAMTALREKETVAREDNPLREAYMRRTIREAKKEFGEVAIVCGAFHGPALVDLAATKKDDDALLKGLPKIKTSATWVPWTHELLSMHSGYGAGIRSPGWYAHLHKHDTAIVERWMTRAARLLRDKDIDCSSAHVIESVRLSATLATMRGRPVADLTDIADATRSVFCYDTDAPMRLIARELFVGDVIGEVPEETPMVPLQRDLTQLQKSLRMKPDAADKELELDLRTETDQARSRLLHQLRMIGVDWGTPAAAGRTKGTFKEAWTLRWQPEYAVTLITAARFGNTVEGAATGALKDRLAKDSLDLAALSALVTTVMMAGLPAGLEALIAQIESVAALSGDVGAIMEAVPPLASAMRYGTVRETDVGLISRAVHGIMPRVIAGLPVAVGMLNDEAAEAIVAKMAAVHESMTLIGSDETTAQWHDMLERIESLANVNGRIVGKIARLLIDAGKKSPDAAATLLQLSLSRGADPAFGAAWIAGFLEGTGLVLVHDARLLSVIDEWMASIVEGTFEAVVPLLRRTFGDFPPAERRQIGQILAKGRKVGTGTAEDAIDPDRAKRVLPTLATIFGRTP